MKKRLRVLFILDNDIIFTPKMLATIMQKERFKYVGLGILKDNRLACQLRKKILKIGVIPAIKLAVLKYAKITYSLIIPRSLRSAVSLEDVARSKGLTCFYTNRVNAKETLNKIRALAPDLVVASCAQIFGKELLSIPKIASINRHSSLLPSYGGILPVLQAIAHGEKQIGVTIHYIDQGIDTGRVIIQESIPLGEKKILFNLYSECFKLSSKLILLALESIERGEGYFSENQNIKRSYYSFPTDQEWKMFKKNGGKFA